MHAKQLDGSLGPFVRGKRQHHEQRAKRKPPPPLFGGMWVGREMNESWRLRHEVVK